MSGRSSRGHMESAKERRRAIPKVIFTLPQEERKGTTLASRASEERWKQ